MLLPWMRRLLVMKLLIDRANKKIRTIDVGRRRQFDNEIAKVMQEYEQYKKKEPKQAAMCEEEAERCYIQSKRDIERNRIRTKFI